LKTAGTQSITATDTVTSSITGSQTGITVSAGSLSKFVLSAPSSATAGTAFTLTVTAEDAYGNTVTSYSSSVPLSASTGAISPTSTGTSGWSNGVWSSTSVTLTAAGSITITANDGSGHTGTATLTVNAAAASKLVVSGFPSSVTAGSGNSVTVTAEDQYGNTVTSFAGTVTISSSDSKAVLPSPGTLTNGVGSFSVTLETAGTQSITASATGVTSGSQTSITVNPASASTLVVSGFPSSVTAGTAGSVTVTAKDAYGNTATGYRGTVKFTSSDGQAALPSNYAFQAGDNGAHTFTNGVTLKTAGTQSITATDTATGTITGSQTGITVNPASIASFTISGYPSSVTAGTNFGSSNVVVTAVDSYGNTVTSYTGSVYFTSTDTQAVLPYTSSSKYTFTTGSGNDNGVHTFPGTGFTLKTVGSGTQTITVTDGTHSATSNSITVTATSFAGFTITGYPSVVTVGTSFGSNNVVVTAVDAYGNTVTGYSGSVYFTSSDSLAVLPYTQSSKYTFTTGSGNDNGVHTFPGTGFMLKTLGSQTITVTDGSGHSAISSSITVANAPPQYDKYATGNAASGAKYMTINFPATTSSGELIVVAVTESTSDHVTSITPTTYNFAQYKTLTVDSNVQVEVWYGWSTTASAQTITINFESGGTAHSTSAVVFSISGASTSSPFDGNANTAVSSSASSSASISTSTTRANDLVIGVLGLDGSSSTTISATGNNNLVAYSDCNSGRDTAVEYQTVTVPSNTQESFSWTGGNHNWGIIEFAIRPP
jgi:hypothetical protein